MGVYIKENCITVPHSIKDFFIDNNVEIIPNESSIEGLVERAAIVILNLSHINDISEALDYAEEITSYMMYYIFVFCIINDKNDKLKEYIYRIDVPGSNEWLKICPITESDLSSLFNPHIDDRIELAKRINLIEGSIENKHSLENKNYVREISFEAFSNSVSKRIVGMGNKDGI